MAIHQDTPPSHAAMSCRLCTQAPLIEVLMLLSLFARFPPAIAVPALAPTPSTASVVGSGTFVGGKMQPPPAPAKQLPMALKTKTEEKATSREIVCIDGSFAFAMSVDGWADQAVVQTVTNARRRRQLRNRTIPPMAVDNSSQAGGSGTLNG